MPMHRLALQLAFLIACACLSLRAQELTLLGGTMKAINLGESSYTWQIDYCQDFYRNFAASLTYINEGHVLGHHRDGYAVEVWGRLPTPHNRFSVSLGLGAYSFYDTQASPAGGTENIHGTAPIISFSGTGYLSNRTFYRLT